MSYWNTFCYRKYVFLLFRNNDVWHRGAATVLSAGHGDLTAAIYPLCSSDWFAFSWFEPDSDWSSHRMEKSYWTVPTFYRYKCRRYLVYRAMRSNLRLILVNLFYSVPKKDMFSILALCARFRPTLPSSFSCNSSTILLSKFHPVLEREVLFPAK